MYVIWHGNYVSFRRCSDTELHSELSETNPVKINFFAKKVNRQVLNTSLEEERWYLYCMVTYHFPPRSQDNNYRLYCTFWWRWGLQNVKSFQVPCFSPKKVKNRSSWFPPTVKTRTYSKLDRLAENAQLLGKDSLL